MKPLVVDIEDLFAEAKKHMESENDINWSVGFALSTLYSELIGDLQQRLEAAYIEANYDKGATE